MKRFLMLIFVALATISAIAEKDNTTSTSKRNLPLKVKTSQNESQKHRAPARLPVEVIYDSDSEVIEVSTDSGMEGTAYLYHDGSEIDSSDILNVIFPLPFIYGEYTVVIIGENWEATAVLELS